MSSQTLTDLSGSGSRANLRFGQLSLSDTAYPPNLTNPRHVHEFGKICLVLEGTYCERIGLRTIHYKPYHCVYHPPGFDHSDRIGKQGMRLISLSFDPRLFVGVELINLDLSSVRNVAGTRHVWRLLQLFESAHSLLPVEVETFGISILNDIVASHNKPPRSPRSFRAAREFIVENYRSNLTLSDVAREIGSHPVYVGQLFARQMKQTMGDFVNDLRVRAAAESLSNSSMPLADIAIQNGFYDQSHFTHVFTRKVGISPGVFRRKYSPAPEPPPVTPRGW